MLLTAFEFFFIPTFMWRVYESREDTDRSEEFILQWQEWIVLPIICIYVVALGSWIFKLFYYHQCFIATGGETSYEIIKGHYDNFEESPHKRGTNCANLCRLVCMPRRIIDSRLDYKL